jgi:hypothetical protein
MLVSFEVTSATPPSAMIKEDDKQASQSSPNDEEIRDRDDDILPITTTYSQQSLTSYNHNLLGVTMMQTRRRKLPASRPKSGGRILKHWKHDVQSDDDLWVEYSYKNKHGQDIYYYCSMLTGKSQLLEPPTGAATIVYQEDIAADLTLRCRVPGPLAIEQLREVPRPRPSLHLEAGVKRNVASDGTSRRGARNFWKRTPKGMLIQIERPGVVLEV